MIHVHARSPGVEARRVARSCAAWLVPLALFVVGCGDLPVSGLADPTASAAPPTDTVMNTPGAPSSTPPAVGTGVSPSPSPSPSPQPTTPPPSPTPPPSADAGAPVDAAMPAPPQPPPPPGEMDAGDPGSEGPPGHSPKGH